MKNLRDHEGYLFIDNRNAPMPDEIMRASGLPSGSGRGIFESATYTCNHCKQVVVLNPDRKRERAYCRGCNHLICDGCGVQRAKTGECKTFEQMVDQILSFQR